MGRKPLPKSEVRRVISVSLKPATIEAIDHLRGDTTRSRWVEEMVGHLEAIGEGFRPKVAIYCTNCYKTQPRPDLDAGDISQCYNRRCSLTQTTFFEAKVIN